jgi:hypothetical protein
VFLFGTNIFNPLAEDYNPTDRASPRRLLIFDTESLEKIVITMAAQTATLPVVDGASKSFTSKWSSRYRGVCRNGLIWPQASQRSKKHT